MMKKLMGTVVAVLGALLVLVPSGAAGDGVTVTVQDGYSCDYGINIPFTRTGRSDSYTFEIYAGDTAAGAPEVRAEVEVHADSPVTVFLPLRYDVTGPSTHTLKVTAHVLPGREGLEREGVKTISFVTASTPTCGCAAGTAGAFYMGTGAAADPYWISSPQQFDHVRLHLGKSCRQVNDISLAVFDNFSPIPSFTGSYDGGGYVISEANITANAASLFGNPVNAQIENLGVRDSVFHGQRLAAAMGTFYGKVVVRNCFVEDCTFIAESTPYSYTGSISAGDDNTSDNKLNRIENCYASGLTIRGAYVGGISSEGNGGTKSIGCYTLIDSLSSTLKGGAITGYDINASACAWEYPNSAGVQYACGDKNNNGCFALTGAEFADQSKFTSQGWDFDTVWRMDGSLGRPVLRVFDH